MKRNPPPHVCRAVGCSNPPFLGGLCEEHHQEDFRGRERRRRAIDALHTDVLDGELFGDISLRSELYELREWWFDVCDAVNYGRSGRRLPLNEVEYAAEWCICLAQELVDAEIARRAGAAAPITLDATRRWVWDRSRNL